MLYDFTLISGTDQGETEDATPRVLCPIGLPNNAIALVTGEVMVVRDSDGAAKGWTFESLLRRQGGVVTVLETIPSPPNLFASAGDQTALAAAGIALFSDETQIGVTCTGIAATIMEWSVRLDGRVIAKL
jgi:hypothetical protein